MNKHVTILVYLPPTKRIDFIFQSSFRFTAKSSSKYGELQIFSYLTHAQTPPRWISQSRMVHWLQWINLRWQIIITQRPWFTLGFTVAVVHFMDLNKCIITCMYHYSITQNSFTSLSILCDPSLTPL